MSLILFLTPIKTGRCSYHHFCYYECRRFYRCPHRKQTIVIFVCFIILK
jgi:hypothetical protein